MSKELKQLLAIHFLGILIMVFPGPFVLGNKLGILSEHTEQYAKEIFHSEFFSFGTFEGFTLIDPLARMKNQYSPSIYLVGSEMFNRQATIGKKDLRFGRNFPYLKETELSSETMSVQVETSNSDRHRNSVCAGLGFLIPQAYYQTWWFLALVSVLIIVILYRLYRLRVMNIRAINSKLTELVSERTDELEIRNREIASQHQEIVNQRDLANSQRDMILTQKEELEKHRHRLEELVEERTRELVEAKESAEESDRVKTAFLQNISHEIRTPMNAIVGFINLLNEKIDDKRSRDYYMRIIKDSGKDMLRLVQDVIDFSRMQIGQLEPEYTECDAKELITSAVTTIRERAARNNPKLSILAELPDKNVQLYTDEKKLTQVFSKLVENAMKFTESGHIKMGIRDINKKNITFFVEDTGSGIEKQDLEEIFNRFFTQNQGQMEETQGSGLGLAFAKLATEILGGKIWVESQVNIGSVFYFSLPYIEIVNKPDLDKHPDKISYFWPGKRVLVAEDESSNFLLIEAILKDTKVELIHAADGIELLEKMDKEEKVDLVLLDLKMPRMGGINAMKIIRDSHSDVPVIVQTAYGNTNHRGMCEEIGCNDFLVKPLMKKELLSTLKKFLG